MLYFGVSKVYTAKVYRIIKNLAADDKSLEDKSEKNQMNLKLTERLRCQLCWKIAFSFFILVIMAAILLLIPAFYYYRANIFQDLEQRVEKVLRISLKHKPPTNSVEYKKHVKLILEHTLLSGLAIYDDQGKLIIRVGLVPQLSPNKLDEMSSHKVFMINQQPHFYSFITAKELQLPYQVTALVNAEAIYQQLVNFFFAYWDEFLLIAILSSLFSFIFINIYLVNPIIKASADLKQALAKPELLKENLISTIPNHELGFIFKTINRLFHKIDRLITSLHSKQKQLNELNSQLESKVVERTKDLSDKNLQLIEEIASRKQTEINLKNMALFPEQNTSPILRVDSQGEITYANKASQGLLKFWKLGINQRISEEWLYLIQQCLAMNQTKQIELVVEEKTFLLNLVPLREEKYLNIYATDISIRKEKEKENRFLSGHNPITGLYNRGFFIELLNSFIAQQKNTDAMIALFFMGINDFKNINHNYGHTVGDALLKKVSDILKNYMPKNTLLGQANPSHFLLAIPKLTSLEQVNSLAMQLISLFKSPKSIENHQLRIGINIGISVYPMDTKNADELLQKADLAMYYAYNKGHYHYQFYTETMNQLLERSHRLYQDLHDAIDKQQFTFLYQPQLNLATHQIISCEALLRWHHPEKGMISPVEFIPLLEESHLIFELTPWLIDTALKQLHDWHRQGYPQLQIAINLTAEQFVQDNLISLFAHAIEHYQIPPGKIELEITERVTVSEPERTIDIIQQLKKLGIQTSLDDFGADYSSLRYLSQLPIAKIKIDQEFIKHIETNTENKKIVKAMISLAKELNLSTLAEGIETQAQVDYVAKLGCDAIQGFYVSRPLSSSELLKFLQARDNF